MRNVRNTIRNRPKRLHMIWFFVVVLAIMVAGNIVLMLEDE
jgi:hypothetical protein